MSPVHGLFPDMDDKTFAILVVSSFMQVVTILQMPAFLGASFNPFTMIGELIATPFVAPSPKATSVAASIAKRTVAESKNGPSDSTKPRNKTSKRKKSGKSKRS